MLYSKKFVKYRKILHKRILNNSIKWNQGILRGSGKPAGWTIDMREEIFTPRYSEIIAELFMKWIEYYRPDYVAGLATVGGFLASQIALLSHIKGLPTRGLYIRKAPKVNGLQKQIEGPLKKNSTVVIVDDAINSGKSAIEAIDILAKEECATLAFLSILNFKGKGLNVLEKCNIPLHYLFDLSDLSLISHESPCRPSLYAPAWQAGPVTGGNTSSLPFSSLIIANKRIIINSDWGRLIFIHTDGILEKFIPFPSSGLSTPLVNNGNIYPASSDGFFSCFDLSANKILWRTKISDYTDTSSPVFSHNKKIIFAAGNFFDGHSNIFKFNANNGEILWDFAFNGKIWGTPAVYGKDELLITGSDEGIVCALDMAGKNKWIFSSEGEVKSSVAIDNKNGFCYFASCDGSLYCLKSSSGKEVWKRYLSCLDYTGIIISGEKLLVSASSGYLFCLNKKNGEIIWQKCLGYWDRPSFPTVFKDRVYIGNSSGDIKVLKLKDGSLLWSYATGSPIYSSPFVLSSIPSSGFFPVNLKKNSFNIHKGIIFTPPDDNGFIEMNSFDFTSFLWSFKKLEFFSHKSALLVISGNGNLYCFLEKIS